MKNDFTVCMGPHKGRRFAGRLACIDEADYRHRRLLRARAVSGQAAAPPSSVMNWRRLMPRIGLPPAWRRRSVYRTLNLPQRGRQVLGVDLNCSESTAVPIPPVSAHDAAADRCTAAFQSGL